METVVVERSFPEPRDFADLERREAAVADCLTVRRVRALASYFSRDRCRLVCVYESPDAESVRQVQDESGLPYESIWTSVNFGEKLLTDPRPRSAVVVKRSFPEGTTRADIVQMMDRAGGCLHLYNVTHALTMTSNDLRTGVCLFAAPDAEALRIVNETSNLPSDFVFTASVHMPSE